jgi:hypothetical protein
VRQNIEAAVGTLGTTSTGAQGKIFFDGEAADVPLREGRLPELYTIDDIYFQQAAKALARAGSRLFYNLFYPSKGSKAERD